MKNFYLKIIYSSLSNKYSAKQSLKSRFEFIIHTSSFQEVSGCKVQVTYYIQKNINKIFSLIKNTTFKPGFNCLLVNFDATEQKVIRNRSGIFYKHSYNSGRHSIPAVWIFCWNNRTIRDYPDHYSCTFGNYPHGYGHFRNSNKPAG